MTDAVKLPSNRTAEPANDIGAAPLPANDAAAARLTRPIRAACPAHLVPFAHAFARVLLADLVKEPPQP